MNTHVSTNWTSQLKSFRTHLETHAVPNTTLYQTTSYSTRRTNQHKSKGKVTWYSEPPKYAHAIIFTQRPLKSISRLSLKMYCTQQRSSPRLQGVHQTGCRATTAIPQGRIAFPPFPRPGTPHNTPPILSVSRRRYFDPCWADNLFWLTNFLVSR